MTSQETVHVFTFGLDHTTTFPLPRGGVLADYWVEVRVQDSDVSPRSIFVDNFTRLYCPRDEQFAFEYKLPSEHFQHTFFPKGCLAVITIDGLAGVASKPQPNFELSPPDELMPYPAGTIVGRMVMNAPNQSTTPKIGQQIPREEVSKMRHIQQVGRGLRRGQGTPLERGIAVIEDYAHAESLSRGFKDPDEPRKKPTCQSCDLFEPHPTLAHLGTCNLKLPDWATADENASRAVRRDSRCDLWR
jgi:hypothetical protein